jgi:hypothetical protein
VSWAERLAIAVGLASLFSFTIYTVLSPNTYLALSSMLVFIVSAIALAELRILRELEKLESRVREEMEELLKALEQGCD